MLTRKWISIVITKANTDYFLSYINNVLEPARKEFLFLIKNNEVKLHHAYSFNAILAHAIDYMVFIINKIKKVERSVFVKEFDDKFRVEGSIHINNKFRLLDAVNNSFKHVELDRARYSELIKFYGNLSFNCLKEDAGKIFFVMPNFRFDYCRVVLRPISAIFLCGLESHDDVMNFISGDLCGGLNYGIFPYDYEATDAIDRMTDHCNPQCMDCGESYDNCDCQNFIYDSKSGEFNPNQDSSFEFDDVVSTVSGTREYYR